MKGAPSFAQSNGNRGLTQRSAEQFNYEVDMSHAELLLGVDLGTQGLKVIAVDAETRAVVATAGANRSKI